MPYEIKKVVVHTLVVLGVVAAVGCALAFAIPLYRGHVKAVKMSEGIAGVATIRSAFRVYAAGHNGEYPDVYLCLWGDDLGVLGIKASELTGKFFKAGDYMIFSEATHYKIYATLPGGGESDFYGINQDGVENTSGYIPRR